MELWQGSIAEFVRNASLQSIQADMLAAFYRQRGHQPSGAELDSWALSLPALATALQPLAGEDIVVVLEYRLPLSDHRVDVLLLGRNGKDGLRAVAIELKQWSEVIVEDDFSLNVEMMGREYAHPSQQALDYVELLEGTHSAFSEGAMTVTSCAYLHNLRLDRAGGVKNPRFADLLKRSPVFVSSEETELVSFVRSEVGGGSGKAALEALGRGRFKPSAKLLAVVEETLNGDETWNLIDEQRIAYNHILAAVKKAISRPGHHVVLVNGAAGTGKTVIAVQLLADALRLGFSAAHATGGRAFTTVMRSKFERAAGLFLWNLNLRDAPTNSLDLLLVDEAHRVRETSDTRFTPKARQKQRSQMEELINAARVSVFLLDENQYMRPDEVGSGALVRLWAATARASLAEFNLTTQFRCGGSTEYIDWIDALLKFGPPAQGGWGEDYRVSLASVPADLDGLLEDARNNSETARLVAGFCWKWSNPDPDGSLTPDVRIGAWARPWNAKAAANKTYKPENHPYTRWAESPEGEGQIGCIYSAQGFEFDRVGVIWGRDLVWRSGEWVAQRDQSYDQPVKTKKADTERLLRNAYRVLLTRATREVRILCLDAETEDHLREALKAVRS